MNEGDTTKKAGKRSLFKRFTEGSQSTTRQRDNTSQALATPAPAPPTVIKKDTPTSAAARPLVAEPLSVQGYDLEDDIIEPVPPTTEGLSSNPQNILDGGDKAPVAHRSDAAPRPVTSEISKIPLNSRRSLIVEEAINDDNSVANLNPATMTMLALHRGDSIIVRGKRRHNTVLIVMNDDGVEENKILLNKVARNNIRVKLGDKCKIYLCNDIQYAERVHIVPFEDSIQGLSGNIFQLYLQPYFLEAYRPVRKGDTFLVRGGLRTVEFKVLGTIPGEYGIVAPHTIIHSEGVEKREEQDNLADVGYDDVGGYRRQMTQIREIVGISLLHPHIFKSVGSRPPRGILLYGPPGTGKSLMVRAVANEIGVYFFPINAHEIMSTLPSDAELGLRSAFTEAKNHTPAIIFFDNIDIIAPRHEKTSVDAERRFVSLLLTLIDGLPARSKVFVMAASNKPNSIDPALRSLGRLEREIEIGIPDSLERLEILRIHTKNMKLEYEVDLELIADNTHGYIGSELVSLCSEAVTQQIREKMDFIDPDESIVDDLVLETLCVTMENFRFALGAAKPSPLRKMLAKMSTAAKRSTKNGGLNDFSATDTPPLYLEEWLESLDNATGRCMSNFRFAYLYDKFEPKGIDTLEVFNELGKNVLVQDFGLSLGVALKLAKWAKDDIANM